MKIKLDLFLVKKIKGFYVEYESPLVKVKYKIKKINFFKHKYTVYVDNKIIETTFNKFKVNKIIKNFIVKRFIWTHQNGFKYNNIKNKLFKIKNEYLIDIIKYADEKKLKYKNIEDLIENTPENIIQQKLFMIKFLNENFK